MSEQLSLVFDAPLVTILTPDEIYAHANEVLLGALREDRRIEKKSPKMDRRVLGEYYSMWANTKPSGGLIAIGIENDGTVSGCSSLAQEQLNQLEKTARDFCGDARSESTRVAVRNARGELDYILLVRVFYREDKVVRTASGKAFVRVGDDKRELSEEEIRELQIDKRELDLERELATDLAWPDDFEQSLVQTFCNNVRDKWVLGGGQTDEQILSNRRLGKFINGTFVPNAACVLVFAKDPMEKFPGCQVRFLRFDGELEKTGEHYNVVKDYPVEGPIPRIITRVADILESQLRDFSELAKDGKFYSLPEYPRSVWHEAVVNACVHRSYGLRSRPVFVKMFDDRLVVESPGGFPPTVTPQNIYDSHSPRNPVTMGALKYLDFVKCQNEGTRRMRDRMAESKLPTPEFEQKGADGGAFTVRVTLRNNVKFRRALVDSTVHAIVAESLLRGLDDRERLVLNFIAENGEINVSQCQRQLEMSRWHTAKRLLFSMVKKGLLRYHKTSSVERGRSCFVLAPRKKGESE